MILFTILLVALLAVAAVMLVTTILVGGSFVVVFGDAMVFALLVWLIIKIFERKKT